MSSSHSGSPRGHRLRLCASYNGRAFVLCKTCYHNVCSHTRKLGRFCAGPNAGQASDRFYTQRHMHPLSNALEVGRYPFALVHFSAFLLSYAKHILSV